MVRTQHPGRQVRGGGQQVELSEEPALWKEQAGSVVWQDAGLGLQHPPACRVGRGAEGKEVR